jgi:chromosome segregation ATPase
MTLEEQLADLTKKFEKAEGKYTAQLTEMQEENNRMKNHMNDAVAKEKAVKLERNSLQDQFDTFKTENELGKEQNDKMNEIIAQKLEKKQEAFDTQFNEVNQQLTDSQKGFTALKSQYDNERISGAIRKAAETAGVIPGAIDDVIGRASGVFSINEEGSIESRDSDGNLRKIGKKIASPDAFIESLKDSAAHFWPASQGGGASGTKGNKTDSGANPWMKETRNFTKQAQMKRADPDKAARMEQAAQG